MSELSKLIFGLAEKYNVSAGYVFDLILYEEKKFYQKHPEIKKEPMVFYFKEVEPIVDRYLQMKYGGKNEPWTIWTTRKRDIG